MVVRGLPGNKRDGLALLAGTGGSETTNVVGRFPESVYFDTGSSDGPVYGYFDFLDVVGAV